MRSIRILLAAGFATILAIGAGFAAERATLDEAKALAEKAAADMKAVGPEKAMAEFNDPKGGYQDRDLYVFVYTLDGKIVCIPGIPALLNRDATTLKDVDGKEFGKTVLEIARTTGSGWLDLRMTNPISKKIEPKRSYVIKTGDYIVGVGAYTP
jgi:signal transduction histidine kinase